MSRLLHFRFTFATIAILALFAGALLETVWLAAPGAVAAAISDIVGVAQSRVRFALPADRAFRGASESLPAIGVAAFEPWAIGVAVVIVIYTLMANGLNTIMVARKAEPKRYPGETLRRLLCALAGVALLWIPIQATTDFDIATLLYTNATAMAVVASAVAGLAGMRSLLDMYLHIRRA